MHINKPKWPGLQKQCLFVHLSLLFFELLQRAPFLIISFIFHCLLSDYLVSHVIKTTAEKPVSGERCKRFQLHGVAHKYHNSLLKQCKVGLNNLLFFFNQKPVLRWRESRRSKSIYESNKSLLLLQEQNIENIQTQDQLLEITDSVIVYVYEKLDIANSIEPRSERFSINYSCRDIAHVLGLWRGS